MEKMEFKKSTKEKSRRNLSNRGNIKCGHNQIFKGITVIKRIRCYINDPISANYPRAVVLLTSFWDSDVSLRYKNNCVVAL